MALTDSKSQKKQFDFQSSDSVITTLVALSSEPTIRIELEFAHQLNVGRLVDAIKAVISFEPVLSTRLVMSDKPYYESIDIPVEKLLKVVSSEKDYELNKCEKVDIYSGPLIECCLLQSENASKLLFKIAHEAADGFGAITAVQYVAEYYSKGSKHAVVHDYNPLSRSPKRLLKEFKSTQYPWLFWLNLKEKIGYFLPKGTMAYHTGDNCDKTPAFYTHAFDSATVGKLRELSKKNDLSLNDILLAAFLRASADAVGFSGDEALRILLTINLRRYIKSNDVPSSEICNLSAMECVNIKKELGADLLETARRVAKVTSRKKKVGIGLSFVFDMMMQEKMKFETLRKINQSTRDMVMKTKNFAMTVTNVGRLKAESFTFDNEPKDFQVYAPFTYTPFWCTSVYEFNGELRIGGVVEEGRMDLLKSLYTAVDSELSDAI